MVYIPLTIASVLFAVNLSSVLAVPVLSNADAIEKREPFFSDEWDYDLQRREPLVAVPFLSSVVRAGDVADVANAIGKREVDDHLFARGYDFDLEEREFEERDLEKRAFLDALTKAFGLNKKEDKDKELEGARKQDKKKKKKKIGFFDWVKGLFKPKKKKDQKKNPKVQKTAKTEEHAPAAEHPTSVSEPAPVPATHPIEAREHDTLFAREYDFALESRDMNDLDVLERRGLWEGLLRVFGIKHDNKKQDPKKQSKGDKKSAKKQGKSSKKAQRKAAKKAAKAQRKAAKKAAKAQRKAAKQAKLQAQEPQAPSYHADSTSSETLVN